MPPPMPALAKNRSIGPNASSARSMSWTLPASVEMSAITSTAPGQRVGDRGDAVEVGDDHSGAGGVEAAGEGGTDATGRSGDDDMAVVEVHRQ